MYTSEFGFLCNSVLILKADIEYFLTIIIRVKPWPNDANIFAQQMPTMLGINVGIVWPPMLGIVG